MGGSANDVRRGPLFSLLSRSWFFLHVLYPRTPVPRLPGLLQTTQARKQKKKKKKANSDKGRGKKGVDKKASRCLLSLSLFLFSFYDLRRCRAGRAKESIIRKDRDMQYRSCAVLRSEGEQREYVVGIHVWSRAVFFVLLFGFLVSPPAGSPSYQVALRFGAENTI